MNIHFRWLIFENESCFFKLGEFGIIGNRALGNYVAESSVANDTFRIKC